MKCFTHSEEDAVAICKTCGKGVCSDCAIILGGTSYCKTCVEAGRSGPVAVRFQPTAPMPTGVPTQSFFIVGSIGSLISGVMALFLVLVGGFLSLWWTYRGYIEFPPAAFSVALVLLIGLILGGVGYLGLKRNYGRGIGTAGFVFSIVVCAVLIFNMVVGVLPSGYGYYYYQSPYSPWYLIYILSAFARAH